MAVAWIKNEDLFVKEVTEGYGWQQVACDRLRSEGIEVEINELSIRASIEDIPKYKDEIDLRANGRILEVKSRRLVFTSPEDFPYECAFVDTVRGFEAKKEKPTLELMVSRSTETILGLNTASKPLWYKSKKYDNIRGITEYFYICRKRYLFSFSSVVDYLRFDLT